MDRRGFLSGSMTAGALALGGCATAGTAAGPAGLAFYDRPPPLAPIRVHPDRLFDITVCLRPFRAAGPRLDVEQVAGKRVVHNYGHGGSGWSLSWGSAAVVVPKAMEGGQRDIAVIGCGALGLAAALTAQREGARVTIYAKERMPYIRSARATGTWSPDSRVAKAADAPTDFPALWEQMTRTSFKAYRGLLGLPGEPVEWTDRYNLSDESPEAVRARHRREDTMGFAAYGSRVADLTPRSIMMPPGSTPFPTRYVQRNSALQFNIAALGHVMLNDFLLAGGKLETMEFDTPADLARLPQPVVINCTGYGARTLWKDESIIPVRGQIAWLIPQPEVKYGISYRDLTVLPRTDGIVIQGTGPTEAVGWNDANETPDRAEAERELAKVAELYSRMKG
ncbi:MAG: D-amino-acid oxidase [Caulobacterales bacterium 32-69-10]|nr:MAG: D-amino-acid oxidase [Caulobacterales bacterium 32-69-10]